MSAVFPSTTIDFSWRYVEFRVRPLNTDSIRFEKIKSFIVGAVATRSLGIERGDHVRVLCGGKHGISDWDVLDTFSSLRVLKRFGVKVHKQKNLRLHAKLLIADNALALVGSMNIDRAPSICAENWARRSAKKTS